MEANMRARLIFGAMLVAMPLSGSGPSVDGQDRPPPLAEVLERTSAYVATYLAEASNVVAEEDYLQRAEPNPLSLAQRRLRSDLAVVHVAGVGWFAYRDVFEVDGRLVRDREERLTRLFSSTEGNGVARARQIASDSARYNLNPEGSVISRTINVPTTALRFVEAANVGRSRFSLETTRSGPDSLVRLRFVERTRPRLVSSPDEAPAVGFVVVQPSSGLIVESELSISTENLKVNFRTKFGSHPRFRQWLPVSMDETYDVLSSPRAPSKRVEGHATYTNYRRFDVTVDVK
jgi:hypothetical protein